MKYFLDTNICIYLIKKSPAKVFNKILKLKPGSLCLSSIVLAELQFGVYNSQQIEKNQQALEQFLAPLEILDFPQEACKFYGKVRAHLRKTGKIIGMMDLLIAAHALYLDYPLVTNNKAEFSRVPGLKIENWA